MPYYLGNSSFTFEGMTPLTERERARITGIPPHPTRCSAQEWEAYRLATRGRPAHDWSKGGYWPHRTR